MASLRAEDLPACFGLFQDSVHALAGGCYSLEQCAAWAPARAWDADIDHAWRTRLADAWACRALDEDGCLAGFAWLRRDGEFDMLYVAPRAGRQGLAGRMIAKLDAQAARAGVTALHAWASQAARPVFERAGYQALRANRIERGGVILENWLLAKGGWLEPRV